MTVVHGPLKVKFGWQEGGSVSNIFAGLLHVFVKNKVDESLDIKDSAERILTSLVSDSANTP